MVRLFSGRTVRAALPAAAIALATLAGANARAAATLWYNGDYDDIDTSANISSNGINNGGTLVLQTSLIYDDFTVPVGQAWTVSSVYSNNQMAFHGAPTQATWEIRSGVSAGNGGTLVASGDTAATVNLLNPEDDVNYFEPEYLVTAAVTGVVLQAGTYWLAIAPDDVTNGGGYYNDQSYIETTSGANAVGQPGGSNGNSYLNDNLDDLQPGLGHNFTVATYPDRPDLTNTPDFSMGINGTSVEVPEPATGSLLAIAVAAPLLRRRRNRVPMAHRV